MPGTNRQSEGTRWTNYATLTMYLRRIRTTKELSALHITWRGKDAIAQRRRRTVGKPKITRAF